MLRLHAQKCAQIPCGTPPLSFPRVMKSQTSRPETRRYGPDANKKAPLSGRNGRRHSQTYARRVTRWCCSVETKRHRRRNALPSTS